jgi:hypothetical protein
MHWVSEQYVLRFKIAVYDLVCVEEYEAGQELLCKAPNELQRETLEIMSFDEFVQVHTKQVGGDTQVTTKVEALIEFDHAMAILGVLKLS